MTMHQAPFVNGLRDITVEDWRKDPLAAVNAMEIKLAGLPVNPALNPTLDLQIHQTLRLLRAIATQSYGQLSVLALLDLLLAVDYFLVLQDDQRDSEDHGYDDDAERLAQVFSKHREELDKFLRWFERQQG